MNLVTRLKQPFPCYTSVGSKLRMSAFFGIFISGFLLFFKPFELDTFPSNQFLLIIVAYGLITFFCVVIGTVLMPLMFPSFFEEHRWTTGRQILFSFFIVFLVGLLNYLLSPFLVDTSLDLKDAVWFQGITLAVALLPLTIFFLIRQNQLLKSYSNQANQLEKKLQEKPNDDKQFKTIAHSQLTLVGDYQDEKLLMEPSQLYMITSASNYIKVYHVHQGKLRFSIIRSTIKKTEQALAEHENFFRCHRAFIINLDKVIHVEGNAQGYRLKLENHDELIPVSRNLNSEFSDRLLAFRKQTG